MAIFNLYRIGGPVAIFPFVALLILFLATPLTNFQIEYLLWLLLVAGLMSNFDNLSKCAQESITCASPVLAVSVAGYILFLSLSPGRDYNAYSNDIYRFMSNARILEMEGLLVIDNHPHLALRGTYGEIELIHATKGGGASLANAALPLLEDRADISAIIASETSINQWMELYPSIERYLSFDCVRHQVGSRPPYKSIAIVCND